MKIYRLLLSVVLGLAFVSVTLLGSEEPKVVYPKKTDLDFEGAQIQGELRNPGEFYYQRKPEEKFDSLVKRRKNFHRQMLRDAVMTK